MLDYLIRGGSLIDGSGAPRRTADLGVKDGKIIEIGKLSAMKLSSPMSCCV